MSARLSTRLVRLLNLVPYLRANPGTTVEEAAAELGLRPKELTKDLELLWLCGLPGYGPGDLIDLSFSDDGVEVVFSAGIERPLRLTSIEATVLLIALRALIDQPSGLDREAARSAIAKIEAAAGTAGLRQTAGADEHLTAPADPVAEVVGSALRTGHALRLRYYSASRDAVTERVVDPVQVQLVEGQSYLQAWCREAEGVRLFRFDRIDAATELDEPARPPAGADHIDSVSDALLGTDAGRGLFGFGVAGGSDPGLRTARLWLRPEAYWALDYYPMDPVDADEPGPDGIEVEMRYASVDWMARLLLGLASDVDVLAPDELRGTVTARADTALARYRRIGQEHAHRST